VWAAQSGISTETRTPVCSPTSRASRSDPASARRLRQRLDAADGMAYFSFFSSRARLQPRLSSRSPGGETVTVWVARTRVGYADTGRRTVWLHFPRCFSVLGPQPARRRGKARTHGAAAGKHTAGSLGPRHQNLLAGGSASSSDGAGGRAAAATHARPGRARRCFRASWPSHVPATRGLSS